MRKIILIVLFIIFLSGCNKNEEITISFDNDSGSFVDSIKLIKESSTLLPIPTREGHTFIGWYNCEDLYTNDSIFLNDITLTSRWEINKYQVTFMVNEEVFSEIMVNYQGQATAPINLEKEGYTFIGWDKEIDNITTDLVVNAIYQKNKYKVTFIIDDVVYYVDEVEYGNDVTLPIEPIKDNYIFLGWDKELTNITSDVIINGLFIEDPKGLVYEMIDEVYVVISHDQQNVDVIIPSTYNGLRVNEIGEKAFYSFHNLKSVVINEGITIIGESAFSGCDQLVSVILPMSLIIIEKEAFHSCIFLGEIIITAKVIGEAAFDKCMMLTNVTILDRVEEIHSWAFYACNNIRTITIPSSVKIFGNHIFSWCLKLETVYTPADNYDFLNVTLGNKINIYTNFVISRLP